MVNARRVFSLKGIAGFVFGGLFFFGCAAGERITYERIKVGHGEGKLRSFLSVSQNGPSGFSHSSGPLGLKKMIKMALGNNPEMDQAVARIRQSEAMIDRALASFWPVLSAYGEYVQGNAPSAYLFKTIDQRRLPPGVDFNDPGWFENYEVGFQGRLNLFNGGRDRLRKQMAETGLKVHELDREGVENALITSVIQTYFNISATREYIQIARESVATVEAQLRVMQVRFDAGGALKSDILSLRVRLAQANEDLVRAHNNYSLSIAAMANLLGLDPDTALDLKTEEGAPEDFPADYQTGLSYALAHRPELRRLRQEIVQSHMGLEMARAQYLPRLDAQMKYYLDDESLDFDRERENWTAGVLLHWDFFTGLSTKADITRGEALLEEMLAADRRLINAVALDLKTAYLKLDEAKARLVVARASVAEARESLNLVKRQYEGGSATITRYLDAELARNKAEIRSTAAFYDRGKALAELGRALGYWAEYAGEVFRGDEQ